MSVVFEFRFIRRFFRLVHFGFVRLVEQRKTFQYLSGDVSVLLDLFVGQTLRIGAIQQN